jgi:stress-induced morphogen
MIMNLSLSKRLNEIVEQYIPASPGLSESVIEWFNDWQRETSAVDHADLKAEIQDLKLDIKDLKIELKDEIHALELNTAERFNSLEKNIGEVRSELKADIASIEKNTSERFASMEKNTVLMRSELKEQIHGLENSTSERFASLEKLNIRLSVQMWCIIFLLGVLVFPTIQKLLQH